ncbi:MAG: Glu/Leu/Phe/Val dehydrogenase dimerization domain-containing protein [Candidatus Nanopelagicales bacterium]
MSGHAARRAPFLDVRWTDPETGVVGYLVVDRLAHGVASGGLRMRRGVTVQEVADLAYGMTVKEAVGHRPGMRRPMMGGAKGGIDLDPADPRAQGVLDRYVAAMKPLAEAYWSFGEDLGLRQEQVDLAADRAGLSSTLVAAYPLLTETPQAAMQRVRDAFAVTDAGVSIGDLVGGLGVAVSALTAVQHDGTAPGDVRATVQGFGSIGGAAARFLARSGVRVVAVADVDGVVENPDGLDVEALLAGRDPLGRVDRTALRPGDRLRPREEWLDVEAELLVPAAVSYCLDLHDEHRVRARWVVEGANLPVTAAAESALARRGVTVLPDFVANSATNSWWWWVFFGDVADPSSQRESYDLVRTAMTELVTQVLDEAATRGRTPRAAAMDLAEQTLARHAGPGPGAAA